MIRVTRLDKHEVVLNCDLLESIEARPDTTLRLVTGASLVVRESVEEVLEAVRTWRAGVLVRAGLAGLVAHPLAPVLLPRRDEERASELTFGSDHVEMEIPA
jgi:flagellar protein FlbD